MIINFIYDVARAMLRVKDHTENYIPITNIILRGHKLNRETLWY